MMTAEGPAEPWREEAVSQHPGAPPTGVSELSQRFDLAVAYARTIHADQVRKGTQMPYLVHLLSVAALVIEDGATDEDLGRGDDGLRGCPRLLQEAAGGCRGSAMLA